MKDGPARSGGADRLAARDRERGRDGALRELTTFLRQHKLWWLTPILLAVLLFLALIVLGSGGEGRPTYDIF